MAGPVPLDTMSASRTVRSVGDVTDRGRTLTDSTFARDLAAHRALLQDSLADPTTVAVLRRINSAIMGRMDELT